MPVKNTIPYTEGIFSTTITCYNWLSLIEKVHGYDIVYNWFNYLRADGHYIIGYVIMPNHIHVMIGFTKAKKSINTIIGNGKRFMAYEITKRLEKNHEEEVLNQLSRTIELSRKQNDKLHNVWELSFDWKHCESEKFINQKLDYYHINPVKGVWHLCESPIEYKHSSAKFYLLDTQGEIELTSYAVVIETGLQNAQRLPHR
ncbi:MAG: transposase [Cyclobacteriaceae bacterium]|nr:transposase [Cyclobacteriaceae bacterium]